MRYILERHKFSTDDIKKALKKSIDSGDIRMDIPIDDFIDKSLKPLHPEIGTFEHLVKSGFISMGDEHRMNEYIKRFKELDIDVTKLEKMLPNYMKYLNHPLDPPEGHPGEFDEWKENHPEEYDEWIEWIELSDKYEVIRREFNNEVRKLIPLAKQKLGI